MKAKLLDLLKASDEVLLDGKHAVFNSWAESEANPIPGEVLIFTILPTLANPSVDLLCPIDQEAELIDGKAIVFLYDFAGEYSDVLITFNVVYPLTVKHMVKRLIGAE